MANSCPGRGVDESAADPDGAQIRMRRRRSRVRQGIDVYREGDQE